MKGTRWLAAGALAGVLARRRMRRRRRGGRRGHGREGAARSPATVTTWIMDPGSPKLQEVFKGYATDFEAQAPGHDGEHRVRAVGPGARQVHDRDRGRQGARRRRDGHDLDARVRRPGRLRGRSTAAASGDYVSSLVDAATLDDEVWGKPWYAGARALIYRKDVLEKAGVEVPKTWDELKAAAQTIKEKGGGIYPVALNGLTEHYYLPAIWQAGGEIATAGRRQLEGRAQHARGRRGDRLLHVLLQGGPDPEGLDRLGGARRAGGVHQRRRRDARSPAAGPTTRSSRPSPSWRSKIGTALAPAGPSGEDTAFAGGSHLVVFKESKNTETANAFVDFMLEPANLNKFTGEIGFLPGHDGGHRGVAATSRTRSASRSPSSCSSTRPCTRRRRGGARSRARTSSTA